MHYPNCRMRRCEPPTANARFANGALARRQRVVAFIFRGRANRESRISARHSARDRMDVRQIRTRNPISHGATAGSWCASRSVRPLVYARADNPEFVASAVSLTCKSTTWCRIRAFSEAFAPFPWCFFRSLNELELPEADRERKREGWREGDSRQLDFPQNRRPRRNFVNGNARTSKFPIALLFL